MQCDLLRPVCDCVWRWGGVSILGGPALWLAGEQKSVQLGTTPLGKAEDTVHSWAGKDIDRAS